MSDKSNKIARAFVLLILLSALIPFNQSVLAATPLPPVDMFQLPWDQGIAWYAIDGIDNGSKRPLTSSHHFSKGGAIDFAPRITMFTGEDTSNFWVTAAAAGIVIEKSTCHVRIAHEGGWITEYQFLALVQVQTGETVARNQRLGILADGIKYKYCAGYQEPNVPHLHFMLRPTLIGATFAGWQVKYSSFWNTTTFTKDGTTVGLFKPLMNLPLAQSTPTPTPTSDGSATNTPAPSQPTVTPGGPTNTPDPSQPTATPDPSQPTATPDGQATNTPDPSQPTNTPDPSQPTSTPGGATNTPDPLQPTATPDGLATPTPTPAGPYVLTTLNPANVTLGDTTLAGVSLHNIPVGGFTSAEFTCTYDPAFVGVSNIAVANLFGADAVTAINGPQNGAFIVAIAGTNGNKALTDGTAFTFDALTLQAGQTTIACSARVSQGTNVLTPLSSSAAVLTILGLTPTPIACDKAEFIGDVTLPPGTMLMPGQAAAKVWRVKNAGSCTWTPAYGWSFVSGALMDASLSNTFADNVLPGQEVDIYTSFIAPTVSGHYQSFWKLRNASSTLFGVGDADDPLLLDIVVSGPTVTPILDLTQTPPPVPTSTVPSGWLTFTNLTYGFQFQYPPEGQIVTGGSDSYTRINLPFTPGTNLTQKYLEMSVAENVSVCQSPLATQSILETSETVVINGITFLKQTGGDGGAGHINTWTAYSTARDNFCVSLDFVLRAANPGVFSTSPPLFDEEAESAVFGQIAATYLWLAQGPTATPTVPSGPVETSTPAPTSTLAPSPTATPPPFGMLTGQVLASKPVTVNVFNPDNSLAVSVSANTDGTFALTIDPGTYTVTASAVGFLSAQASITITGGNTTTLPTFTLPAGDIDSNNVIDQFDALTIGMSYNTSVPTEADLNDDGIINVLDLEALALNYRRTGPVLWE